MCYGPLLPVAFSFPNPNQDYDLFKLLNQSSSSSSSCLDPSSTINSTETGRIVERWDEPAFSESNLDPSDLFDLVCPKFGPLRSEFTEKNPENGAEIHLYDDDDEADPRQKIKKEEEPLCFQGKLTVSSLSPLQN